MKKVLKILLPTIFQIAKSASFFLAATTEVISSGKEVPIATIVSQIITSLNQKNSAISTAQSTTHFEPIANPKIHPTTYKIATQFFSTTISLVICFASFISALYDTFA
jgi:hypothetical protein